MRTQATSVPVTGSYDSISWSNVQTAFPSLQVVASRARKIMSEPTVLATGLIGTAPMAQLSVAAVSILNQDIVTVAAPASVEPPACVAESGSRCHSSVWPG